MATLVNLSERINLKDAVVLLLEPNDQGMEILTHLMVGFGARKLLKASRHQQARAFTEKQPIDLVICEGIAPDGEPDGYDFVNWLRRSGLEPNAFCPVIMASAHTSGPNVARARDCGANFTVVKPLAPTVLLERILWVARENRPFVTCTGYQGPDRRFKNEGPPPGSDGRRATDLPGDLGEAMTPNLSQDEIDTVVRPQRMNL